MNFQSWMMDKYKTKPSLLPSRCHGCAGLCVGDRLCWGVVTAGCTDGGGGERDGAVTNSDPAAAPVAWE
jgi:hypothetical protein